MGVRLVLKNAYIPTAKSLGKILPVNAGIQFINFGGDDVLRNQIINGGAVNQNGTISKITNLSSDFSENGFINTGLGVGLNGTYLVAFRVYSQPSSNNTVMGIWPYGAGISLLFSNSAYFAWMTDQTNASKGVILNHNQQVTDFKSGQWVVCALRWVTDGSNTTTLQFDVLGKNITGSIKSTAGSPVKTTTSSFASIRVGTGYISTGSDVSGKGHKEMGFCGIWNRYLNNDEMNSMYNYLKDYFSRRGITL